MGAVLSLAQYGQASDVGNDDVRAWSFNSHGGANHNGNTAPPSYGILHTTHILLQDRGVWLGAYALLLETGRHYLVLGSRLPPPTKAS